MTELNFTNNASTYQRDSVELIIGNEGINCKPENENLHPAIKQFLALGYEVGSRVTGRNIAAIPGIKRILIGEAF